MSRSQQIFRLYVKRYLNRRLHVALILFSAVIMFIDLGSQSPIQPLRGYADRVMIKLEAPFIYINTMARDSFTDLDLIFNQRARLEHLEEENKKLRLWYLYARALEVENSQYQNYFSTKHLQELSNITYLETGVDYRPAYNHSLFITPKDKIFSQIPLYAPVINQKGMVGRVSKRQNNVIKIMLLSHPESRIPVQIGDKAIQGVLAGTGGKTAELHYITENTLSDIQAGDRVVSSGGLGYVPSGIPVGVIQRVHAGGADITLNFQKNKIQYIGIIHGLDQDLEHDLDNMNRQPLQEKSS